MIAPVSHRGGDDVVPDEPFDAVAEVLVWVQRNRQLLYLGPLGHGVIGMDAGDRRTQEPDAGDRRAVRSS